MFIPNVGMPGISAEKTAKERRVSADGYLDMAPAGRVIDGPKTRDPNSDSLQAIRAGTLMGIVTSSGKYANAVIGSVGTAYDGSTTLNIGIAESVELVRRYAASTGTVTVTGPPTAAGTVRQLNVAFSAVNQATGNLTVTAANVNEVLTLNFTNSPAGTFRVRVKDSSGVWQVTQRITYSATIGTLLSNLQAATDAVLAANAIVWSGSVVTAVAGTFSGTGYAALPQDFLFVDGDGLTAGDVDVTRTAAGVDGRFVAGSFVGQNDGSASPVTFVPDGWGEYVPTDSSGVGLDIPFSYLPIRGILDGTQLLPWPADASQKQWVRDQLNLAGSFRFAEKF